MIGRDRSTSGMAPRALRWNKRNLDRGLVDVDFKDKSTSNLELVDVDQSQRRARRHRPRQGKWGALQHLSRAGEAPGAGNQTFQSRRLTIARLQKLVVQVC